MDESSCVVVLGANSFPGQDLVDLLLSDPSTEVLGISRSNERSPLHLRYLKREREDLTRYRYHSLDLNHDLETVKALIDDFRPSCVVNFAARSEAEPSWLRPEQWFETNVVALSRLVSHLADQDYLERLVQISTACVYGDPTNTVDEDDCFAPESPYAASKAAADLLLATYHAQLDFPVVTVRPTQIYGAGQLLHKTVPRLIAAIRRRQTLSLEDGASAAHSLLYVRDVSRGILAAIQRGRLGETYNLAPERGVSLRELVARICDLMNTRISNVLVDDEEGDSEALCHVDSSRARTELGWAPTVPMDEGLEEVIQWVDENWPTIKKLPSEYIHQP